MDTEISADPQSEIAQLEARIDDLRARIDSCRKAILLSRLALGLGSLWIAAWTVGLASSTEGFFLAIAACLGGIVGGGSSDATRRQAALELTNCAAERDMLIDRLALRPL